MGEERKRGRKCHMGKFSTLDGLSYFWGQKRRGGHTVASHGEWFDEEMGGGT